MEVLLLAAGRGERLRPLTDTIPKPLLPVLNIPLIAALMNKFHGEGFSNFRINSFHLAEKLEEGVLKNCPAGAKVNFSREDELLGTGGGIKKMARASKAHEFVVSNSDALYGYDLKSLLRDHEASGAAISLVFVPFDEKLGFAKVSIGTDGRITDFRPAKAPLGDKKRYGIFTGIHLINMKKLPEFPNKDKFCIIEDYYGPLVKEDFRINAIFPKGPWLETGEPHRYLDANLKLLGFPKAFDFVTSAIIKKMASPSQGVYLGKDCLIDRTAVLSEPVIIGERVKVLPKSKIGPFAVIGDDAVIGEGSNVERSVILGSSSLGKSFSAVDAIVKGDVIIKADD